ncbi:uncharacterized protein LOC110029121 isoform X3 [Phalaenopsis equestris]|uniref:uncharacterized protein LOC110029121 isoform X3 n=1 Tax=Phalaenopsis equestris TaxID=78828 RepID=UPI0009E32284|nr:uncharacterized protein LOC110029121 isoform X3 [Phalaenopsis equestris]
MGSYLPLSAPPLLSCKFHVRTPAVFSRLKETRACRSPRKSGIICALEGKLEASWIRSDGSSDEDGFGGWSVLRVEEQNRTGFSRVILAGIGTSVVAVLLATLAYCSFSRKGFKVKLSSPFGVFHDNSAHYELSEGADNAIESATSSIQEVPLESAEYKSASEGKKRIVISVADATQLEALNVLRILKIIDYDANADDLCTKREYARWLVKANVMLERKAKNRLVPTSLLAGSVSPAFDDVNLHDPDFECIQALGEAGIVSSRLSSPNSSSLSDIEKLNEEEGFYFFPNNFISRFDLVNWTAMLEYSNFLELEISRTKPRLLDLCARNLNAAPQLLADLISGNRGIVARTFGNIRCLQPNKPVTKAQAAVALTSGRMAKAVQTELARLEAEELLRSAEMEEIKLELTHRGVIQKHWEEKLSEAKIFALQSEKNLEIALTELEIERAAEEDRLGDYLKEKMALECQQQLLFNLRKEVDELKEKLRNERGVFTGEKQDLETQLRDLDVEKGEVFEARSVLEAEKDAVQIMRSWVEEEAEHIRARANVLEQAVQRWKGGKALSQQ